MFYFVFFYSRVYFLQLIKFTIKPLHQPHKPSVYYPFIFLCRAGREVRFQTYEASMQALYPKLYS